MIGKTNDIFDLEVVTGLYGIEAKIELSSYRFMVLKKRKCYLSGRIGYGICSVE
jgi:FdhD protein